MKSETEKGENEKSVTNFRLCLIAIVGQYKRKKAFSELWIGFTRGVYNCNVAV